MSSHKRDADPSSEDEQKKQQQQSKEESYESLQSRLDELEALLTANPSASSADEPNMPYPALHRLTTLKANLADIQARIAAAHKTAIQRGTLPDRDNAVTLVAVSKLKPSVDIAMLYNKGRGHLDFGENYAQELTMKSKFLPDTIRWHFIGGLQTSACKTLARIPNLFSVHSLDSAKKAEAMNKIRPNEFRPIDCYIQINTSGEENKSGLVPGSNEVTELAKALAEGKWPRLKFKGLMTIGALARSQAVKEGQENEDFECLVSEAGRIGKELGLDETEGKKVELSMGMSEDFEGAIAMGSTCVRVGSSIFGSRPSKDKVAEEEAKARESLKAGTGAAEEKK